MSGPFTDAELHDFLAGTLADEARLEEIAMAIEADPALAERAEALAQDDDPRLAAAVRDAFAPVLDAPVPAHLAEVLAPPAAEIVDLGDARRDRAAPLPVPANDNRRSWRWPQFGAMAASLALGVMIGGPLLNGGGGGSPSGEGLVLASADLDAMLDSAPSGQKVDLASLGTGEVVLTFRDTEGRLCRQFMLEGSGGTSDALACAGGAAGGAWQVEAFGRRAAPVGEMKLAGGDAAPAVVAAVDALIGSDPVVGADEIAELGKK
jgi:hypothetical protein